MRRALLALVLVVAAACSSDDGDEAAVTTVATTSTTSSTTTSTSTTLAPTTSTTALPPAPKPTAQEAVDYLLGAWRAGDQVGALTVAVPDAVDALFAIPPEAPESRGCNEPPGGFGAPTYCVYRLTAGELQVRAAPVDAGFIVDLVRLGGG